MACLNIPSPSLEKSPGATCFSGLVWTINGLRYTLDISYWKWVIYLLLKMGYVALVQNEAGIWIKGLKKLSWTPTMSIYAVQCGVTWDQWPKVVQKGQVAMQLVKWNSMFFDHSLCLIMEPLWCVEFGKEQVQHRRFPTSYVGKCLDAELVDGLIFHECMTVWWSSKPSLRFFTVPNSRVWRVEVLKSWQWH